MTAREMDWSGWDGAEWSAELLRGFRDHLAQAHGAARRSLAAQPGPDTLLRWAAWHLPHHFAKPPSQMHRWLAARLDAMPRRRGTKLNLLAPRGGAKSTVATLAYVLRVAVEGLEPYVWIISDTRRQAHAHLENIQWELEDNARLAAAYPAAVGKGPVWRAGAIQLRNGVRIEALGTGQRIRGRRHRHNRPSLILCDDLENDGHMLSALQRERSRTWFHGTLLKAGTSTTNVVNLATALHREALAMQLHHTPGWTSRIFPAIVRWPKNMSLWEQWEEIYTDAENPAARQQAWAFYQAHRAEMDENAAVLWPEQEDLYTLMCMRAESGRGAFEREKQNSPIHPELCEWPEAYFDEAIWFHDWPNELVVKTIALDPSKGGDARRSDYSAYVLLGVDRHGVIYLEADLARRPTSQMVADGVALCRRFRPDAFGIEANQFQQLLAPEFEAEFQRQGILGARPSLLDNRLNKQVRIRRLGPYLSSRRLRFKAQSPSTRLLVEQLRTFPVGDHDDGPDAAEMALRLASELLESQSAADSLGHHLHVD